MRLWCVGAVMILVAIAVPEASTSASSPPPVTPSTVILIASSPVTTLTRNLPTDTIDFTYALRAQARFGNFEVRVKRASYSDPILATVSGTNLHVALPASATNGFSGFVNALHVRVATPKGQIVADFDSNWCPNAFPRVRMNGSGPSAIIYPDGCFTSNPFTIATVWGIERGWSTSVGNPINAAANARHVADGTYILGAQWNAGFAKPLGFSTAPMLMFVKVQSTKTGASNTHAGTTPPLPPTGATARAAADTVPIMNNPPLSAVPDLAALPAWGITTSLGSDGHDYLNFGATVWDAGPTKLMVEGTRLPDQAVMDAWQFFYSGTTRIGRKQVGSMEYDPRVGHMHWHFHDFAAYDLLDANQANPVRSGKESFCLANTDTIDMTVKNALWRIPIDTLSSVCGTATSTFIRETMAVGYGDTYQQFRPGQAFDITGVPNGTYYIRITANPLGRLSEVTTANNVSLRKVILGGDPGNRTVDVPPYGDVNSG
jgi:hypothetical protein